MTPFELVAVRHGRTAWNVNGRFQGHTNVPLDETGRRQAESLAEWLAADVFDAAATSDLRRTRETAEIILGPRGLVAAVDPRWREMEFGQWEGLTWAEITTRFPQVTAPPNATSGRFLTPPDGESFDQLCARVALALDDVRSRTPPQGRALVVTHAGPLHALMRIALGQRDADALGIRFAPAGITRIAFSPEGAQLLALNQSVQGMERRA